MMYSNTAKLSATRKMTMLGILAAIAYVVMFVGRIPITSVEFLKYDPKDIIIAFSGLIYGPLSALLVSVVVSLIEMVTVSSTGVIGLVMNILSSASFACTASFVYKKWQTQKGAAVGLLLGVSVMAAIMMVWNYLITPLYMPLTREAVAAMLMPVFLPFNLIKGGLNAALTMLLYKPLVKALRNANLLPPREMQPAEIDRGKNIAYALLSGGVLVTCVLVVLVLRGII